MLAEPLSPLSAALPKRQTTSSVLKSGKRRKELPHQIGWRSFWSDGRLGARYIWVDSLCMYLNQSCMKYPWDLKINFLFSGVHFVNADSIFWKKYEGIPSILASLLKSLQLNLVLISRSALCFLASKFELQVQRIISKPSLWFRMMQNFTLNIWEFWSWVTIEAFILSTLPFFEAENRSVIITTETSEENWNDRHAETLFL